MGVHIGNSEKMKIMINGSQVRFVIADTITKLLSSENLVLKSSDGLYLVPKESE